MCDVCVSVSVFWFRCEREKNSVLSKSTFFALPASRILLGGSSSTRAKKEAAEERALKSFQRRLWHYLTVLIF